MNNNDIELMRSALELADQAGEVGEVPVGAVVAKNGIIIGRGYNRPISASDPTAHAEVMALRDAAQHMRNYRLLGCTLYVTLEPCAMREEPSSTRVSRDGFWSERRQDRGSAGASSICLAKLRLNHHVQVTGNVLAEEGGARLKQFFSERRKSVVSRLG